MKHRAATDTSSPSWDALLLVCKTCRRRSQAPKGLKNKAVVQQAKRALSQLRPRPRVVLSSCLGLCPKAATAVAVIGGGRPARIVAIHSQTELDTALPMLVREQTTS